MMSHDKTLLQVHLQPNAKQNEIIGFEGDILRIKVTAQPIKGKANKALIDLLSKSLGVRKSNIAIEKGETSKQKVILIQGLTMIQIKNTLGKLSVRNN